MMIITASVMIIDTADIHNNISAIVLVLEARSNDFGVFPLR